jgi:serine/threonine protein kinase/tetratricopeptide (TPR) repeat protein
MTPDPEKSTVAGSHRGMIDAALRQVEAIADASGSRSSAGAWYGRKRNALPPAGSFPGYRVEEEIHRGGQGVVFKALQESTARHVAIKILRDGSLATEGEIARFEQEVRILGRLRHPNIVAIFDSQAFDGRFYYVMDYIAGLALDGYVRQRVPKIEPIVRLFVKICDAVNVAHLHGIIHRDLKPGNIRVDESGEPFVLDFGLSKLTDQTERSSMTLTGQFVGSAPWASPEQASGKVDAIDLRTDVYALGVLLYQMLTGRFPYMVTGTPAEVLGHVLNTEPTPPRKHRDVIDADLETIVLKCLQKDPERRYQSAGELGRDLSRYLRNEPIEARRDSFSYMLRKHLVRYRLAATVAAAFLMVLIGGIITTTSFWRHAVGQRDRAILAEQATDRSLAQVTVAHDAERAARLDAEREAEKARQIAEFIQGMLASIDPATAQDRDRSLLKDLLDEASRTIDDELGDQPEVRAALHNTIGFAYYSLSFYEQAEPHLQTALDLRRQGGAATKELVNSLNNLGLLLKARGEYVDAAKIYREALAIGRTLPDTADTDLFTSINNLARLVHEQGDYDEAIALYREALALPGIAGTRTLRRALGLNNLALLLQDQRDYDAAEPLLLEALGIHREVSGSLDPDLASSLDNLGTLYIAKGHIARAEAPLLEALAIRRKVLEENDPKIAFSLNNLANFYHDRAEYDKAEAMYLDTIDVLRVQLGDEHPHIATTLNNLASLHQDRGDYASAEPLFRESLALRRKLLGERHPQVAESLNNLALLLIARRDFEAAEATCRESLDLYRAIWGADHPRVALSAGTLAALLADTDRLEEAAAIYVETLATWRRAYGEAHPRVVLALRNLASVKRRLGELPEAEGLYRQALETAREVYPAEHRDTAAILYGLGVTLLDRERASEAESAVREALAIREAVLPADHWLRFDTQSLLGATLVAQGRFADAEPLLLAAQEGLADGDHASEDGRARVHKRLIELYEKWGRPEPAARWRHVALEDSESERVDEQPSGSSP